MNKIEPEHREAARKISAEICGVVLEGDVLEQASQIIADCYSVSALREEMGAEEFFFSVDIRNDKLRKQFLQCYCSCYSAEQLTHAGVRQHILAHTVEISGAALCEFADALSVRNLAAQEQEITALHEYRMPTAKNEERMKLLACAEVERLKAALSELRQAAHDEIPRREPQETNAFANWWASTNNGPWFAARRITAQTLRHVAFEVWQCAQAHVSASPALPSETKEPK